MKINSLVIIPVAAGLLLAGCVSSKKYRKLETDLKITKAQAAVRQTALEDELNTVKMENSVLNEEKALLVKKNADTRAQYDNILGQLNQEVQEGQLKISQYQNMLRVDLAEQIFFTSGSSRLKRSGNAVLKKVGAALSQYNDKIIWVVGHTDNVPIARGDPAYTNWELSGARATNVARFLQDDCQIAPERLIAAGRAEYNPIASNDTPEGRQKNRRIEIMLIDKGVIAAMQEQKEEPAQQPAQTEQPVQPEQPDRPEQ